MEMGVAPSTKNDEGRAFKLDDKSDYVNDKIHI